jgi:hypothetical protein
MLGLTSFGPQKESVVTARSPANGYFVLNSRDRFINADPVQKRIVQQPYNDFLLQKAQALIPSYARRLQVSEVRFPFYIPNIVTGRNDKLSLGVFLGGIWRLFVVELDSGFYTPSQLATTLNGLILSVYNTYPGTVPADCLTFTYNPNGYFTITAQDAWVVFAEPNRANYAENYVTTDYYALPSLALTLGFDPRDLTSSNTEALYKPLPLTLVSVELNPTTCLYTDYVDICSSKLMRFTDASDGGSGNNVPSSLVCRIYVADEASLTTAGSIPGYAPFIIHRQFKTPKTIEWNSDSFVADLDIQVQDMYGDLVPIGTFVQDSLSGYPDFQLTLLCSEE